MSYAWASVSLTICRTEAYSCVKQEHNLEYSISRQRETWSLSQKVLSAFTRRNLWEHSESRISWEGSQSLIESQWNDTDLRVDSNQSMSMWGSTPAMLHPLQCSVPVQLKSCIPYSFPGPCHLAWSRFCCQHPTYKTHASLASCNLQNFCAKPKDTAIISHL